MPYHLYSYIHQNPVKHGFVEDPSDWPFNSYNIFLSRKETQLERDEGLSWFGGEHDFVEFHQNNPVIRTDEFY
jgi:hypothetical protein